MRGPVTASEETTPLLRHVLLETSKYTVNKPNVSFNMGTDAVDDVNHLIVLSLSIQRFFLVQSVVNRQLYLLMAMSVATYCAMLKVTC
jgi:hypothetical protein